MGERHEVVDKWQTVLGEIAEREIRQGLQEAHWQPASIDMGIAAMRASIRSAVEQEIAEYIYRYAAYQTANITRPWFPRALAELADAIASGSYRKERG